MLLVCSPWQPASTCCMNRTLSAIFRERSLSIYSVDRVGRTCFCDIWIFAIFLIGYIEFCQSLFSRSERLTYYVLKYDNFKFVEVQCWMENAVPFHIEWLCRKTTGNVNRSPYCYTAVTHWACPASSASVEVQEASPPAGVQGTEPVGLRLFSAKIMIEAFPEHVFPS